MDKLIPVIIIGSLICTVVSAGWATALQNSLKHFIPDITFRSSFVTSLMLTFSFALIALAAGIINKWARGDGEDFAIKLAFSAPLSLIAMIAVIRLRHSLPWKQTILYPLFYFLVLAIVVGALVAKIIS
ncbi:MAG: hypothetical protein JNJ83_13430 [Verrucomicrobiaceae bacterium]|nr:hypothetical protein [Verrucomicrobiaceae bacterium]